jgi:molybdenum cofactor cytidylyltransferase
MTPAFRTNPELIRLPVFNRHGIAKFHVGAAPLTPNVEVDFAHGPGFYTIGRMIPAIVLAAGKSSRMGRSKAALALSGGDTFITRLVRTFKAASVDDIVVVVGHDAKSVVDAFAASDLEARFVENLDYEQGQLSSLVAGLTVVDRPGVVAALVTLVDVPLVDVATVRAVLDRYHVTHAPVVRPVRGTQHGHPVLIDRSLFEALRRADPSAGAKSVIRAHASPAGDVPVDDDGAFADADTPEDYERMRSGLN